MEIEDGYSSGEIARICGITKKTLRHYEKIGLLKPHYIDPDNNYRFYTHDQIYFIDVIKSFKKSNIQLKDIKGVSFDNVESIIKLFNKQIENNKEEIEKLNEANQHSYRWIEFLDWFKSNSVNEYKDGKILFKIKKSKHIAYESENGHIDEKQIFKVYNKLVNKIRHNNLFRTGPFTLVINTRKEDFDPENIDYELFSGVSNHEDKNLDFIKRMPELNVASIIHKGSSDGYLKKIEILSRWIKDNNYKIIGPVYYSFILPLGFVKKQKHVITEIYRPIQKLQI